MPHKIVHAHIILLLVILYLLPVKAGYTPASTWQHLVFMFFHGNIFHLIGNCYCAYYILNNRTFNWHTTLVIIYTVAVLSSFVCYSPLPTVGFSAPLFGMLGINFYSSSHRKNYLPLLLSVMVCWLFIPHLNTPLHILCFILGYLYTWNNNFIKKIRHDCARLNR